MRSKQPTFYRLQTMTPEEALTYVSEMLGALYRRHDMDHDAKVDIDRARERIRAAVSHVRAREL